MYLYIENNIVRELIPDTDPAFPSVSITERYPPDFMAQLVHVPDDTEVDQRWVYDPATGTFSPPPPPPEPGPRQPTALELAQQEITDKDLEIIANAQALTDLELMMIGGISHV